VNLTLGFPAGPGTTEGQKGKTAMTKPSAMIIKRLPSPRDQVARRSFLREIKRFVVNSHRPRLIVDLSAVEQISPESVDLLLECVRHTERGDGEVSIAAASPQTDVILEITQAASVLNIFSSVLEAVDGRRLRDFESWTPACPGDRVA
jgi:anti-anti-sigma regulatory factor